MIAADVVIGCGACERGAVANMMVLVGQTTMERMTAVATDPSAATPPATTLSAEPAERVDRRARRPRLTGVNRWVALGAALLLHAAILAPIWLQFDWVPQRGAAERGNSGRDRRRTAETAASAATVVGRGAAEAADRPRARPRRAARAATEDKTPHYGDVAAKNAENQGRARPAAGRRQGGVERRRQARRADFGPSDGGQGRRRAAEGERRSRSRSPSRRRWPPWRRMRKSRWRR